MGEIRAILVPALSLLSACSLIHDLDPDKLPSGDAGDDTAVLDSPPDSPADSALDSAPDSPGDTLTEPDTADMFEDSCGPITCSTPATPASACDLFYEDFEDTTIDAAFTLEDPQDDACISITQCPGFLVMNIPRYVEHLIDPAGYAAPSLTVDTGLPASYRIDVGISQSFNDYGQIAGIIAYENSSNIVGIIIEHLTMTNEINMYLWDENPTKWPPTEADTIDFSSFDGVLTLEKDGNDWTGRTGAASTTTMTYSINPTKVGLYTGNYSTGSAPETTASFDYICISSI